MINSYSTVANARILIGDLFSSADYLNLINRANERILNSGLWKGAIGYAAFPTVENFFALPYPFLAVIGAQWFRCPIPVFGQFHDFVMGGPGQPVANQPPEGIVEDLGDGYATAFDPPEGGGTLQIVLDLGIDIGKTFRFFGEGSTREVFDVFGAGMYIPTTGITTNNGTVFVQVTGIQPPINADGSCAMIGGWTLNSVDGSGNVTELGYYYPNQANPMFRRYRIGDTTSTNTEIPNAVTVLVRRRFMPVYKDTDYIIPGNIGALTFGMQAIDSENAKNDATELWDKCFAILNQELHATRGAARPESGMDFSGGMNFGNCW